MRPIWFLFSFEGRIGRESYWLFFCFCLVLSIFLQIAVGNPGENEAMVFWLILLWPALAVIVKRYHDRNKSGLWSLVHLFIPPLGIVECGFFRGTSGVNRFGPDVLIDHLPDSGGATPIRKWLCLLAAVGLFLVGFFYLGTVLLDLGSPSSINLDLAERFWGSVFGITAWWAAYFYLMRGLTRRVTPGRTDRPEVS